MSLKLTFNDETKKIGFPKDYDALCAYVKKAFQILPMAFKFFYVDSDGDMISVTQDDDLQQFKESEPRPEGLKLHIFGTQAEASNFFNSGRSVMGDTFRASQASVINMP